MTWIVTERSCRLALRPSATGHADGTAAIAAEARQCLRQTTRRAPIRQGHPSHNVRRYRPARRRRVRQSAT